MRTHSTFTRLVIVLMASVSFSCSPTVDAPHDAQPSNIVYFTSFESQADTSGWKGVVVLHTDVPHGGGKHSAFVSGGCIVPHAFYEFSAPNKDCELVVRCWAKNLTLGGVVALEVVDEPNRRISISVEQREWKGYVSEQSLSCRANQKLRLSLISGGFVSSSMLIDLIEVKFVDE